jgi:hypothetical protein
MDIFCLQNPQKKKKKKTPPKKHGEFLNPQGKTSYKIVYIASHQNRFETLRRLMVVNLILYHRANQNSQSVTNFIMMYSVDSNLSYRRYRATG